MTNNGSPKVLTALDVAELLRLTDDHKDAPEDAVASVHRLVREKGLRPISGCGKSYRFAPAELDRWIMDSTKAFENRSAKSS